VLYRDGTIEQFSTGFERAFAACKEDKVLYIYEETPNGFRFTFFRTQRLESGGYIAEDADPFGRGYNNYTQDLREYAQDDTQGWSSNTQAPRGNTQDSTQDNVQNCDSYTQVRSNDTRGRKESTQKNTQADIKGNIGSGYGNQVLSNLEKSIVDQLRSNPRLSQSGLAEILDINVNTLKAAIRRMTKQGLLSREGTSQKGYWVVHLDHQKN
jgi:DNA-binding CsgD family transcriptional regulator